MTARSRWITMLGIAVFTSGCELAHLTGVGMIGGDGSGSGSGGGGRIYGQTLRTGPYSLRLDGRTGSLTVTSVELGVPLGVVFDLPGYEPTPARNQYIAQGAPWVIEIVPDSLDESASAYVLRIASVAYVAPGGDLNFCVNGHIAQTGDPVECSID